MIEEIGTMVLWGIITFVMLVNGSINLEINGLLNTEKTVKWCRARKQKRINDAFKEEAE